MDATIKKYKKVLASIDELKNTVSDINKLLPKASEGPYKGRQDDTRKFKEDVYQLRKIVQSGKSGRSLGKTQYKRLKEILEHNRIQINDNIQANDDIDIASMHRSHISRYLTNKKPSALFTPDEKEELLGSFCIFRRAYSEPNHINVATINIYENELEPGVIKFDSVRKNTRENIFYAQGIVLKNAKQTGLILSLTTANNNPDFSFFETISFRFKTAHDCLNWDGRYNGIYNAIVNNPSSPFDGVPFSTRCIIIPIADDTPDIYTMINIDDKKAISEDDDINVFYYAHERWTRSNGLNIKPRDDLLEDIYSKIESAIHSEYGAMMHFHPNEDPTHKK